LVKESSEDKEDWEEVFFRLDLGTGAEQFGDMCALLPHLKHCPSLIRFRRSAEFLGA
jgi:hypothetical protein